MQLTGKSLDWISTGAIIELPQNWDVVLNCCPNSLTFQAQELRFLSELTDQFFVSGFRNWGLPVKQQGAYWALLLLFTRITDLGSTLNFLSLFWNIFMIFCQLELKIIYQFKGSNIAKLCCVEFQYGLATIKIVS